MNTGAETGGTRPQAKGRPEPPEAGGGGGVLPWRPRRERGPAHTLISGFCLQNWREEISVVLSHQICDKLLQQPQKFNIECN